MPLRHADILSVPSAFCTPRQWVGRKDSIFRGQPRGIVLVSDAPAQRSSRKMPWETWTSTRLVESLVSLSPSLMGRVVGIDGFCGTPECHRATNELLRFLLPQILASSLPCFIAGDFNCPLETLEIWSTLQSLGSVDANQIFHDSTGFPLMPMWKGQTRIDFILVPPSLITFYFTIFYHTDATVSDHSFIAANLELPGVPPVVQVWKTCKDARSLGINLQQALGEVERNWEAFDLAISLGRTKDALKASPSSMKNPWQRWWLHLAPSRENPSKVDRTRVWLKNHSMPLCLKLPRPQNSMFPGMMRRPVCGSR